MAGWLSALARLLNRDGGEEVGDICKAGIFMWNGASKNCVSVPESLTGFIFSTVQDNAQRVSDRSSTDDQENGFGDANDWHLELMLVALWFMTRGPFSQPW